jgi:acyl-coenzyme A synthetase/AMP-(fatty) acid ligase
VRHTGAKTTPEAAVLAPDGRVAYVGRIDDLFVAYGKRRHAPTTRELRDALDAVLAGREVAVARAPGVGCEIPTP